MSFGESVSLSGNRVEMLQENIVPFDFYMWLSCALLVSALKVFNQLIVDYACQQTSVVLSIYNYLKFLSLIHI